MKSIKGSKGSDKGHILCQQHNEKCNFVCLYKVCPGSFKPGCSRCRKDHGQHPNRLITITQLHNLLNKPIRYLQNSTAFKLMNLKKKIEYIRNFRSQILQKQIQLIENNNNIKQTMSQIFKQHCDIRDIVSRIDEDTLLNDPTAYNSNLIKCRDFLAYNPVNRQLVFNNQIIKNSRVGLEKHLKVSNEVIDSIREFLVKIIEVLLAHCAYQQEDDDIEFQDNGGPDTTFNIYIKTRKDASETPNIKSKLEHQDFLEIFNEEKEALSKQVELLQKQIQNKSTILQKIRSSQQEGSPKIQESLPQSISSKQANVFDTIKQEKTEKNQAQSVAILKAEMQAQVNKYKQSNAILKSQTADLTSQLQKVSQNFASKIATMRKTYSDREEQLRSSKDVQDQQFQKTQQNYQKTLKQYKTTNANLISAMDQVQKKQLELKSSKQQQALQDKQITLMKQQLAQMTQKMSQMSQQVTKSLKEATDSKAELHKKQKAFVLERAIKEKSGSPSKSSSVRQSHNQQQLQTKVKQLTVTVSLLQAKLQQQQQNSKTMQQKFKESIQKCLSKQKQQSQKVVHLQQQIKTLSSNTQPSKSSQQQKKYKQNKQMLDMSIKQNQQLKDQKYQLQIQVYQLKKQIKQQQTTNLSVKTSLQESKKSDSIEHKQSLPLDLNISFNEPIIESKPANGIALKQKKLFANNEEKKQAYMTFKQLFKTVTEDMHILEQRLKQNNVIEKVYLKELQRKRNQNKQLRKQIQNFKLYGKHAPQAPRLSLEIMKTAPNAEKPPTNNEKPAPSSVSKHQGTLHLAKKYAKPGK